MIFLRPLKLYKGSHTPFSVSGSLMAFELVFLKYNISGKGHFRNSQQEGDCRVNVEVHCAVLSECFLKL